MLWLSIYNILISSERFHSDQNYRDSKIYIRDEYKQAVFFHTSYNKE